MNLTDIQKGYIAGIVDGEGYIGLSKGKGKFSPRLGIGMTNYETLKWLKDLIGGCLYQTSRSYITDSPCWTYVMTPTIMREVLPVIAPYLITKNRQAYLMLLYFSYFKKDDRDAMKGLKAVIKVKFHSLFKILNSRGNRKQGKFKEHLSEATLSQALEEIQEKVQRLNSDATNIREQKIVATLKKYGKMSRYELGKCHYNNFRKNEQTFNLIMEKLEKQGVAKKVYSKYCKDGFSYIYANNDFTNSLPERDDIVRTDRRLSEVEDKELSR